MAMTQRRGGMMAGPFRRRWQPWAAVLLLTVLLFQLLGAATQLSMTVDEGFHITSGYEYVRTGHVRLFDEHTPVAKALFAWPLFFVRDLTPPEHAPGWEDGSLIQAAQETLLAYQPIDRVIVPSRVIVALLTVVLGATVYRWAAALFGSSAGVFALLLFVFDPNILAHGSLATTDMGAVAFIFWATWGFAQYLGRPSTKRWWVATLLLGLALGAKLTAMLLLPVFAAMALVSTWLGNKRDRARALLRCLLVCGGVLAAAAVVVWAIYLFEVRTLPDFAGGAWPLPAASHIERWIRLQDNLAYGRESFLLGQNGMHGWWQYFPIAFVLKTPLPTLLLGIFTLGALFAGRRRSLTEEMALWFFPLVYGLASLTSTLNIGYRHLLPVLPFLFVSSGRLLSSRPDDVQAGEGIKTETGVRWRVVARYSVLGLLVLWLIVETTLMRPHFLAYFNSLAGRADQGYRYLADSNTDWGQTQKALADYQRSHNLGTVRLSQFTFLDPATYGVDYEPIAPMVEAPPVLSRRFNPEPGLYAISATTLDGVPLPLPSMYDWFRHREPIEKIGYVMFLYDVTDSGDPPGWVAQCASPVVPLTEAAANEGFGVSDLRQIVFDCEQSWIYPQGGVHGVHPGWYARAMPESVSGLQWPVPNERLEWWPEWVTGLAQGGLRLSYIQPTPGELPPFAIWQWGGTTAAPSRSLDSGEVSLGGTLAFIGYRAPATAGPGETVDVLTFWRVLDVPERPLSLMLHLVGADGIPVAVGDGLGISIDQWKTGDVIVQRHSFALPEETPTGEYGLQTGAYWLDTLERWSVNGTSTDSVILDFVQVER